MNTDMKKQGKRNRAMGATFERRTQKDLEDKGWFVSRFQSNVDLEKSKLVNAKASRFRLMSTGFPDFIIWNSQGDIAGVECKVNGILSMEEREKAKLLLQHKVFDRFIIANKIKEKNRVKVVFKEFGELYDWTTLKKIRGKQNES